MKNYTVYFFILLNTVSPQILVAQSFSSFSDVSIVLHTDSSTKSVLISNLMQNKSGYLSPIIGTASWLDKNNRFHCSSLVAFNYGLLPQLINPDLITKAQLVFTPVYPEDQVNESNALRISVRRVLEYWDDSTTTWENQPVSNLSDEVIININKKRKGQLIRINVTEIVRNMFRYENNGFMISYKDSANSTSSSGNWFASSKNENIMDRPFLLISYAIPARYNNFQNIPPLPLTAQDKTELMQMYIRPEPVIVTQPVKEKTNNQ